MLDSVHASFDHCQSQGVVEAPVARVFAYLDDHRSPAAHMNERSWRMGWGRMTTAMDEDRGQRAGSRIRLAGRVFGIRLWVDEVVTERSPPLRKVWETTGEPQLLVIGRYRMGFELTAQGAGSQLRVFIDYALPPRAPARWLGLWLGRRYARWCTQQMVDDAKGHFSPTG